jgi:hypothetical protein
MGVKLTLIIALLAACVFILMRLWELVHYEANAPFNGDSPIFWAVGRGILNGLIPYRDMFETKSPGIFILSSFSLLFGNNGYVGGILQALAFFFMPVLLMTASCRMHRRLHVSAALMLSVSAICFGSMLALYAGERSGEFQVESFGAVMAIAYMTVLVWNPGPMTKTRILLAAATLFGAIGMKEPFALTTLAVALILAHHPKDIVKTYLIPAVIAGMAGLTVMALLGYLMPYVQIYLPEMLGNQTQIGDPLWKRALIFRWVFNDVSAHSHYLAWSILLAFAGSTLLRMRSHKNLIVWGACTVLSCAAVYLLTIAIATGGFFWNHNFVFAMPGYAAIFLVCIREISKHWGKFGSRFMLTGLATLIVIASFRYPNHDYGERIASVTAERKNIQQIADNIDALLDSCGMERYLYLGANGAGPYGFTRHSPMGPLFIQFEHWVDESRPEFRRAMLDSLDESSFVVVDHIHLLSLNKPVENYLDGYFTETPWPCAEGIALGGHYRYLYRSHKPVFSILDTVGTEKH